MVFSGKIYTAAEMHEMGVVDVLAEDGMGEQAVYDFVEKNDRSFASRRAVYATRQIINPITRAELDRIVEMWVDAALSLGSTDLQDHGAPGHGAGPPLGEYQRRVREVEPMLRLLLAWTVARYHRRRG